MTESDQPQTGKAENSAPSTGNASNGDESKIGGLLAGGVGAAITLITALTATTGGVVERIARNHFWTTAIGFCALAFLGGSILLFAALDVLEKSERKDQNTGRATSKNILGLSTSHSSRFFVLVSLFLIYGLSMVLVTWGALRVNGDTTAPVVNVSIVSDVAHIKVTAVDVPVSEQVWIEAVSWTVPVTNTDGSSIRKESVLLSVGTGAGRDGNIVFESDLPLPTSGQYESLEVRARIGRPDRRMVCTDPFKQAGEESKDLGDRHFGCMKIPLN